MANQRGNGGGGEVIGALFGLALLVSAVAMAVMVLVSAGALFGAGTALHNYGRSLRESIRPERPAA